MSQEHYRQAPECIECGKAKARLKLERFITEGHGTVSGWICYECLERLKNEVGYTGSEQ